VDQIAERVLRGLSAGVWPPGSSLPPSRELAAEFGIAPRTLMAALQRAASLGLLEIKTRHPAVVLPGAIERAGELLSDQTVRESTRQLAILITDAHLPPPRNVFYAGLTDAVVLTATRHDMHVKVVPWAIDRHLEIAASLHHSGFDAAIFIGFDLSYLDAIYMLCERRFPLVVFNRPLPGLMTPTVTVDDYSAIQRIGDYLVKLGHRNMCLVANPHHVFASGEAQRGFPGGRTHGWMDFLDTQGLITECSMPVYIPWSRRMRMYDHTFMRVFDGSDRPTAIIFSHGPYAKDFLLDPRFADLSVPEEISLITFEAQRDIPTVPWCPELAGIEIDNSRVAQCMVEMIEKVLAGQTNLSPIRIPMKINMTESVGPAPRQAARAPAP
jgi:DNA-binding LacI/PurR family transcriptional regulator